MSASAEFAANEPFPLPSHQAPEFATSQRRQEDLQVTHSAGYIELIIEREQKRLGHDGQRAMLCAVHEVCAAKIGRLDSQWATRRRQEAAQSARQHPPIADQQPPSAYYSGHNVESVYNPESEGVWILRCSCGRRFVKKTLDEALRLHIEHSRYIAYIPAGTSTSGIAEGAD